MTAEHGVVSGHGALTGATIPFELPFFTVYGHYSDVENPNLSGSTNVPLMSVITGVIVFFPRVPFGTIIYLHDLDLTPLDETFTYSDTAVALAPITARILSGQIQTINVGDSPGIGLLANTPIISAALLAAGVPNGILYYDCQFSNVVYGEAAQTINNFAITAPTSGGTNISLTDPNLVRLPYAGP